MAAKELLMEHLTELEDLWVFGYGSLMWNPGFKYFNDRIGYISGFSRKFYQGNVTHRGRPGNPGRVVTLVEDKKSRVWGRSFHVVGPSQVQPCLEHLGFRECMLGGYDIDFVDFHISDNEEYRDESSYQSFIESNEGLRNSKHDSKRFCKISNYSNHRTKDHRFFKSQPNGLKNCSNDRNKILKNNHSIVKALVFIAVPNNHLYLGPAPSLQLAESILNCEGASGSNLDYMLGILEFLQEKVPVRELKFEKEILEIETCVWHLLENNELHVATNYHSHNFESNRQAKVKVRKSSERQFVIGDSDGENDDYDKNEHETRDYCDDDTDDGGDDYDDLTDDDDDNRFHFSPLLRMIREDASFIKMFNLKCQQRSSSVLSSSSSSSSAICTCTTVPPPPSLSTPLLSSSSSSSSSLLSTSSSPSSSSFALPTITPCPSMIFTQNNKMSELPHLSSTLSSSLSSSSSSLSKSSLPASPPSLSLTTSSSSFKPPSSSAIPVLSSSSSLSSTASSISITA